jgi:hypothetical protein
MKLRTILAVATAAAVLVPTGARANVTTTNQVTQSYGFNWFDQNTGTFYALSMFRTRDAQSTSTNLNWTAAAFASGCPNNVCFVKTFASQQVPGSALAFDPIGNSGAFQAVMIGVNESNLSIAGAFNLTMTRPSGIGYCAPCVLPNAWVDPNTNSAGASIANFTGIFRYGYTVGGTFAGDSITAVGPMDFYSTSLNSMNAVTAP